MSSAGFSKVTTNALYVNIASASGKVFTATGDAASLPAGALTTGNVYRDMGKNLYLPAPTTPNAVGMQSTILRKVQWVPQAGAGYYGTGGPSGTVGSEFFTCYISLGGQTYAGGGAFLIFCLECY